jgi:HAD superfamily hydrolase (TIGR01549 family)
MIAVALFDIDGTLVDTVDYHAKAWQRALARFGKEVDFDEIRAQIGKGGDQLLPVFLDPEELDRFGEELDSYRGDLYRSEYLPLAQAFPHVKELLGALKRSDVAIGLASSCNRAELGYYLRLVGGASFVDAATTADDVDRSKPFPDIFEVCLDKLGAEADDVVAVGDSPYDAEAAGRAGIVTVGLLCGGFPERALLDAGCAAIYETPGELLERLADSPLARGGGAQPQQ